MCGIIGYIGSRSAPDILLNGLKRLEYRGYDSSGMAVLLADKCVLSIRKCQGKISSLENLLRKKPLHGTFGIAHTRWATHGVPNQINAHPHRDCTGAIAIAHNGIIENYLKLKGGLVKEGHKFVSQTDTEVIAHLIEKFYSNGTPLEAAVMKALPKLEGSFALVVISQKEPGKLVGARFGSPLIAGLGKGENFLASDAPAILDSTREIIFLDDEEMVVMDKDSCNVTDFKGRSIRKEPVRLDWDINQAEKQGYEHFMLKEINEQPAIAEKLLNTLISRETGRVSFSGLSIKEEELRNKDNIVIIACGTAYHAGLCAKYMLEETCKIPARADLSSEFRYSDPLVDKDTLVIAISQSGETADTLAAAREARKKGALTLAICNVLGSTLVRECDGVIYTYAGPEIGVASTKAYTAQLLVLYLFALYLAGLKDTMDREEINKLLAALKTLPQLQRRILEGQKDIRRLAHRHSHFGSFLFLGRNVNYPSALEGALKLKEISYIPAEGYAAGEMKHGPIALIDEYRAVVCIAPQSKIYEKMVSNIQEIHSRRGKIIAIASEDDEEITELTKHVIYVPRINELLSPLIVALPLQLLAYYIAAKRGCNVDQPRNLAKSVTVE